MEKGTIAEERARSRETVQKKMSVNYTLKEENFYKKRMGRKPYQSNF